MSEITPLPPPGPGGVVDFRAPSERPPTSRGCLKWGLVGCAGLSVLLIAGLVIFATKAKSFLDSTLRDKGREILAKAAPEVTEEEKEAFRKAYDAFVDRAKAGRVGFSRMTSYTSKSDRALQDGKITPEELRELTAEVQSP